MDELPKSWNPRRNNLWNYSKAKKARGGLKKSKDLTNQKPTPVPLASTSLYNSAFSTAQIPVVNTSESTTRRGPWIAPSTTTTCIKLYLSHLKDDPQPYNDQVNHDLSASVLATVPKVVDDFAHYQVTRDSTTTLSLYMQPRSIEGSWVADSGAANNIADDNATFLKYRKYSPSDVKPTFTCSNGTISTTQAVSPILQHRRLAHLGHKRTKLAEKLGIVEPSDDQHEFYEVCQLDKARQIISRANMPKAMKVGGIIYVDIQHIKPTAHDGSNYATFILNNYSRMLEARFHINKDGASKALIDYCKEFHNSAGCWPVLIAKDLGREFNVFNNWAKNLGILLRHSLPRTKEPNRAIERLQFFIVQISQVMIIDTGLPPNLWPFAIDTTIYIHSRLPLVDRKEALIQIWRRGLLLLNPTLYLEHLRVWGCKAYVYIPIENRVKAEKVKPKALIGRLVGYVGDHGHVYRIWYPDTGKTEGDEDGTLDIVNDVQSMPKAGWGKPISIKVFDANTSSNRSERLLLTGEPSHEDIFTILGQDQETTFNYHENQYAQCHLVTLSPSPENLASDTPIESVESDHKPTSDIQDIQIHDSPPENNNKDLSPDQMQLLQETAATQPAEPQRLELRRSSCSTKGQRSIASFKEEQTTQAEQERLRRAQKKVKFAIETEVNDDPNESTNPNALIAIAATGLTKRK
ncbi:conserved hypothetical protein [Talaromyces stipitatus ATCC 10500]|uniref:Integrase catalytic domain-containing protein n=1 Tax=Talaromyces stipitatus (strain ATCC 10500 / CBS 375.48 / QM 6759 / NRRL 1006) TaxID=441959 RepID=B8MPQ9_TALSN|nr:uncharacterized protein TSTA_052190 [Talaromyces stipitatus ATCC 10500]EED12695.1 conserved hypothetical protein [Talaromyces stipitatus ATCC 10500]